MAAFPYISKLIYGFLNIGLKLYVFQTIDMLKKAYNMLHYLQTDGQTNWASRDRDLLYTNGFGYVWENQNVESENIFIRMFSQRLRDQYLQAWSESIHNSSRLILYREFKTSFNYEIYLDIVDLRNWLHSELVRSIWKLKKGDI